MQAITTSSNGLDKRLLRYGATAAAAIACAGSAEAAPIITYSGPDVTANNTGVWFNPVTGHVGTALFSGAKFYLFNSNFSNPPAYSGGTILRRGRGGGLTQGAGVQTSGGFPAQLGNSRFIPTFNGFGGGLLAYYYFYRYTTLTPGNQIPIHLTVQSGPSGNWLGGGRGFLGLRFDHLGNVHYGWADITVDPNTFAITLHRLAWNDTALAQIHTGEGAPIPEPASVVLLAMGAAGLAAYRRRKAVKS